MKEACDNLRRSNLRREMRELKSSIFDLASVRSSISRSPHDQQQRRAEILAPKTVCQNNDPTNLKPILKNNSRRRLHNLAETETFGEFGLESDSSMTTPSSLGSASFSTRNPEIISKYNSLGGRGRQLPPQRRF